MASLRLWAVALGAAGLAFFWPQRVSGIGSSVGGFGTGLATAISELGSIQIRPGFAPSFEPVFKPDVSIPGGEKIWSIVEKKLDLITTGDEVDVVEKEKETPVDVVVEEPEDVTPDIPKTTCTWTGPPWARVCI